MLPCAVPQIARRLSLLLLASAGLLVGCKGKPAAEPASPGGRAGVPLELSRLGSDRRTTLRALRMPAQQVWRGLGAHRLTCRSRLVARVPGHPAREVDQEVMVRFDAGGQFAAVKNTHPQYGRELIWTGGWLYPRLRWNKFLRRRPEAGEPALHLERLAGLLPAYVSLLRRFIRIEALGQASHQGRKAARVKLGLETRPAPPRAESSPARSWRQSLQVSSLEGEALLDARTGAPLKVELRARWSFAASAPGQRPPTGIPSPDPRLRGEGGLRFSLEVSEIGKVAAIEPPPEAETVDSPRLTRSEIERQMLTGELPLEERWGPP
jgi:hypothetical protein